MKKLNIVIVLFAYFYSSVLFAQSFDAAYVYNQNQRQIYQEQASDFENQAQGNYGQVYNGYSYNQDYQYNQSQEAKGREIQHEVAIETHEDSVNRINNLKF